MRKFTALLLAVACLFTLGGCFWSNADQPAATPSAAPSDVAGNTGGNAAGNAQSGKYADGTYYASADDYSSGWKDFVALTVENGRIAAALWDCLPATGAQLKSTMSAEGNYNMKVAGAQRDWHEQSKLFTDAIVQQQGLPAAEFSADGKTDAVSGVTINVRDASGLFDKAIAQGAMPEGEYQDGLYYAEAQQYDTSGYKEFVSLYVSGGRIVSVNWDAMKENSKDTKKSLGDTYAMKVASSVGKEWYEQAAAFENYVIASQGVSSLQTGSDGKTDAVSGCTISVSGAKTLTEQILTQAKAAGDSRTSA